MKKHFYSITFFTVILIVSAWVVGLATFNYKQDRPGLKYKLGVDLVGGTILVYEMDLSKFDNGKVPTGTSQQLAATLKRRIDPSDLYNVTVRPAGETRVEIILPTGGQHEIQGERAWNELKDAVAKEYKTPDGGFKAAMGQKADLAQEIIKANPDVNTTAIESFLNDNYQEVTSRSLTAEEVQKVKELVKEVGNLEFQILALQGVDDDAMDAAKKYIEDAKTNPQRKAELEAAAAAGKPPPAPKESFSTKNENIRSSTFTYSWKKMDRNYRWDKGLNNSIGNKDETPPDEQLKRYMQRSGSKAEATELLQKRWNDLAEARAKGEATYFDSNLVFSRNVSSIRPAEEQQEKIEYFMLLRDPEPGKDVTGEFLLTGLVYPEGKTVHFTFDSEGGYRFGELTGNNKKQYLAIVLDGTVRSAPIINSKITTSGIIEGQASAEEAAHLVTVLRSGALPATLKQPPVSENTMGATLGADTTQKGAFSVILAFGAILAFMIVYYRFSGLVACVALLANLLLTVAIMVLVNATFTLPGLAGLVLMLGMAVDANVLIYERLREERERGASIALAIRNGYDRAFPTIIDTHLSSIFTAVVLYAVGNDQLRGFGISLTLGLIISLLTSLAMTRVIFNIFLEKGWIHKLSMMDLKKLPVFNLFLGKDIDFMRIRNYWFAATTLLTIFGITVFVIRGEQGLNVDFIGGTVYSGLLKNKEGIEDLRKDLSEENQVKALKVAPGSVKALDDKNLAYEFAYEGGEGTLQVYLQEPLTAKLLEQRLSKLPDHSVEQNFVESSEYSEGNKSRLFTVRTSERERDIVGVVINRLLAAKLQRVALTKFEIKAQGKQAILEFGDPDGKNDKVFASPAQVTMLLQQEFKNEDLTAIGKQVLVTKFGIEEDKGRFKRMTVDLPQAVPEKKLAEILQKTQTEFTNRPQPERLENFDSTLAADTQARAFYAILASWAAILLYLWFRFGSWTFGAAAVLCLIHDLFFTLGIIAFCHYIHEWAPGLLGLQDFKIDLPTVAALLTLVGYSVNDTIVVFDRIREVRGKNPFLTPQMINDGVNQTLSRTLLTSFSVWVVVIVLYLFGGEGVHLFAFVMVVGVIVGTYSSIYIASPLLLIFGKGTAKKPVQEQRPLETARV